MNKHFKLFHPHLYMRYHNKSYLLTILFIFFAFMVEAQTLQTDSLENLIRQHTEQDTTRVNLLNRTANLIRSSDIDKSLEYAEEAGKIADKLSFRKGQAQSLQSIGYYYYRASNFAKALLYYRKALQIYQEESNKTGISDCYNSIGNIYYYQRKWQKTIDYYQKSLEIKEELGDEKGISIGYSNIALIYMGQNDYPNAFQYFQKSLILEQKMKSKEGISYCLYSMGQIYFLQGDYPKALESLHIALQTYQDLGDVKKMSHCYNNIGEIYKIQEDYSKALQFFFKSLIIKEKLGDMQGIYFNDNNIGEIYTLKGEYSKALVYFGKSLKIIDINNDESRKSKVYSNIGKVYMLRGDYPKALNYFQKALKLSIKFRVKDLEIKNYTGLAVLYLRMNNARKSYNYSQKAYQMAGNIEDVALHKDVAEILAKSSKALGLYKEAYNAYVVFKAMSDSMYNKKNTKKIAAAEYKYKYEKEKQAIVLKQQKKDALQALEAKRQKTIRNSFIGAFAFMLIFVVVVMFSFVQKRKANYILAIQKKEIEIVNEELKTTLEIVNGQKKQLEDSQKQINDSINYASRIQQALLPTTHEMDKYLKAYFIFYKPKDVVSGDFYYFKKINKYIVIAVADCTGHGVPGALVSMLGIAFLNEIVRKKEVRMASQILEELRIQVKESLNQSEKYTSNKDGMDIALCVINTETMTLNYAGANNPLYIFSNDNLRVLKATRNPIGTYLVEKSFEDNFVQLQKNDKIYMCSDGYADQFGGEKGKRFMDIQFREVLKSFYFKSFNTQKELLSEKMDTWMGEQYKQIDDMLVLGFEL